MHSSVKRTEQDIAQINFESKIILRGICEIYNYIKAYGEREYNIHDLYIWLKVIHTLLYS